jgi:hypothetical protein
MQELFCGFPHNLLGSPALLAVAIGIGLEGAGYNPPAKRR